MTCDKRDDDQDLHVTRYQCHMKGNQYDHNILYNSCASIVCLLGAPQVENFLRSMNDDHQNRIVFP